MDKTLIVLGAGASKDFCGIFPTGFELIKEINYHFITQKKSDNRDEYISAMMNQLKKNWEESIKDFENIKEMLWTTQLDYEWKYLRPILTTKNSSDSKLCDWLSIDSFIADQIEGKRLPQTAEGIIKFSIFYLIIGYEQALSDDDYKPKNNWMLELAKKISKYDFDDILENLTVLTFNYDRTFEFYFPSYLAKIKGLSEDQKNKLYQIVKHPYDSLGNLEKVPFGMRNDDPLVGKMSAALKLTHNPNQDEIYIENADQFKRIHFIGFGYDAKSLDRIKLLERFKDAKLEGTVYGETPNKIKKLKRDYKIKTKKFTCVRYVRQMMF